MVKRVQPVLGLLFVCAFADPAFAQVTHCDSGAENCRTELIRLIDNETVGIDGAQWIHRDSTVISALIRAKQRGVFVRMLIDLSTENAHEGVTSYVNMMRDAGIPVQDETSGTGILHWKFYLFHGQGVVKYGAANSTVTDLIPTDPYRNYRNETNIFDARPSIVRSFITKFEDAWVSRRFTNYGNVPDSLKVRIYPTHPIDTQHLVFVPGGGLKARLVDLINRETRLIDLSILRLGDQQITNALINAAARGVELRINSEQAEYRDTQRYLHAHALDQLYAAGIRPRWRAHAGQNHEKTMLFHDLGVLWTGSSNLVASSLSANMEHNLFTADPVEIEWYKRRLERRWFNSQFVDGVQMIESRPFTPGAPGAAAGLSPVNNFIGTPTQLTFNGGYYGITADVYFGTTSTPPLYMRAVALTVNKSESVPLPALGSATTYYWKVITRTHANRTSSTATMSFRTPAGPPGNAAPAVSLAKSPSSTSVTAPTTATLTATASDADDGVARVEFYVNGTLLAVDASAPYTATWSTATPAEYQLIARAVDTLGTSTVSDPVVVNVTGSSPDSGDIVLWASRATRLAGAWRVEPDPSAAGGSRVRHPNAGAAKLAAPLASPTNFFELTFQADAGVRYHVWLRGRADNNSWANDSVFVQFTNVASYAIGTTSAMTVTLEDCTDGGVSGWGWQDNAFNATASPISFASSGPQTIRIQTREDGLAIDQIILSPLRFLTASPGALMDDATIYPATGSTVSAPPQVVVTSPASEAAVSGTVSLAADATDDVGVTRVDFLVNGAVVGSDTTAPYAVSWSSTTVANGSATVTARAADGEGNSQTSAPVTITVSNATSLSDVTEIVLYAAEQGQVIGGWNVVSDATAAGGALLQNPNASAAKLTAPLADPTKAFEVSFTADTGRGYRIWLRGKAQSDSYNNDSVYVQFDGSVTSGGLPIWRIGSTEAPSVIIEECSGCGVQSWGWADNAYGRNALGPLVYFERSGPQKMRIQVREDGIRLDQIVLSAGRYLTTSPGATKNDTTILPR